MSGMVPRIELAHRYDSSQPEVRSALELHEYIHVALPVHGDESYGEQMCRMLAMEDPRLTPTNADSYAYLSVDLFHP